MLKKLLIGLGILCFIAAAMLIIAHVYVFAGYLIVAGIVLVGSMLIERWRYRPKANMNQGAWQRTGERFRDPTTGKLVEVLYNPETGERQYREVERPS